MTEEDKKKKTKEPPPAAEEVAKEWQEAGLDVEEFTDDDEAALSRG